MATQLLCMVRKITRARKNNSAMSTSKPNVSDVSSEEEKVQEEEKNQETPIIDVKIKPKNRNVNARGGGGMCPVRGHGKTLSKLNVAELAGLGKASEGQKRELLSIPDGYRLENTGIRIEFLQLNRLDSNLGPDRKPLRQFRGVVYATPLADPTKKLRMVELPKRYEPSWNGVHLHLDSKEKLIVQVQERRSDGDGTWADSFNSVTMDPLKAFTVQDQDVAWLKTPSDPLFPRSDLVWAELSLQKKSSNILEQTKGTNIASKQRKLTKIKFKARKRDAEEVATDEAMLNDILSVDDPMTRQDIVYMKDIWNKCLGWIGMTGEHFVESLFLRCPDLLSIFGEIPAELAFDMFVSIIDLSVRALDPRTEVIAREAYRVMPLRPDIDAPFHTLEEG